MQFYVCINDEMLSRGMKHLINHVATIFSIKETREYSGFLLSKMEIFTFAFYIKACQCKLVLLNSACLLSFQCWLLQLAQHL